MEDTRFLAMRGWLAAAILGSVLWVGSATPVQAWYEGRIVDAETKEPIVGVVVFMKWSQAHLDQGHTFVDASEVVTDDQGRFSLSRYWSWNLWKLAMTNHRITIFKSGYEPIIGTRWRDLKAQDNGKPKDPNLWKIERGRPVIQLKMVEDLLKRRDFLGRIDPGGAVPDDEAHLLRRETEKEYKIVIPQ